MGNRDKTEGFEQLEVWQKSIDIAVNIYQVTDKFPKTEIYSLTSQMRRASSSDEIILSIITIQKMINALIQSVRNNNENK